MYLLLCVIYPRNAHAQVDERDLKAAYIYNFAMFATWQAAAPDPHAFNVCVESDSPLKDALRKLTGKPVDGAPWTMRIMNVFSAASICQIVVFAARPEGLPAELEAAIQGRSVLLITDSGKMGGNQAVITLLLEADHLRFDVDLDAARKRGVMLNSKLLKLARNVL